LGAIGDFGCYSFHETKNYSMGEGGALLIRDDNGRAEIIREKGTNRSQFFRGMVDKYTWVDYGSSYLPSELNAAYLYGQLEIAQEINQARLAAWEQYRQLLTPLEQAGYIELAHIPAECTHNAHMFWIKAKDLDERTALLAHLKEQGVGAVFHYVPLHTAPAGLRFGRFHGQDVYTTAESNRLVRLPMYYGITPEIVAQAAQAVADFYKK
jgi:dTDP-4-amino-4,6-dideoxygalactose transaminase